MPLNHPEISPHTAAPIIVHKYFPKIVPLSLHWLESGAWEKYVWIRPATWWVGSDRAATSCIQAMQCTMQLTCMCTASLTHSRAMDSWNKSCLYHLCKDFDVYINVLSCGICRLTTQNCQAIHYIYKQYSVTKLFKPGRSHLIIFPRKNSPFNYSTGEKHQK